MTPSTIQVKSFTHRSEIQLGLFYSPNKIFNKYILEQGFKWSKTYNCFYIRYDKQNFELIKKICISQNIILEVKKVRDEGQKKEPKKETVNLPNVTSLNVLQKRITNIINQEALLLYKKTLILKAYSSNTIKTYTNEFIVYLNILGNVDVTSINKEKLRDYFVYCHVTLKLSENTIHSRLNAIKFYYEQVLKREKFTWEIPRPKKPLLLPKLLNEKELGKLFTAVNNKKHKAILFTAYSAGLRLSEVINIKIQDIDSKRMQIFISNAKGKKDRYVNLSPVLLDILRSYISKYNPKPKYYLFESEQTGSKYPARTLQQIFYNAKEKACINKSVGIHSLRHSFATHLLEKGTDIKYIKDILGHFDIKTTERYLHVTKTKLVNIISPLDELLKSENIEW